MNTIERTIDLSSADALIESEMQERMVWRACKATTPAQLEHMVVAETERGIVLVDAFTADPTLPQFPYSLPLSEAMSIARDRGFRYLRLYNDAGHAIEKWSIN